jgi:hypothetical protein
VLNIAIVDLEADWGVSLAFPARSELSYESLDPGKERTIRLKASLPAGLDEGADVLKVFATVGPADFRVLTLPPLDQPGRPGKRKDGVPASALDALLDQVAADQPRTRDLTAGVAASEEWTVAPVQLRVRKPRG